MAFLTVSFVTAFLLAEFVDCCWCSIFERCHFIFLLKFPMVCEIPRRKLYCVFYAFAQLRSINLIGSIHVWSNWTVSLYPISSFQLDRFLIISRMNNSYCVCIFRERFAGPGWRTVHSLWHCSHSLGHTWRAQRCKQPPSTLWQGQW